jgi:hypothetical protein
MAGRANVPAHVLQVVPIPDLSRQLITWRQVGLSRSASIVAQWFSF